MIVIIYTTQYRDGSKMFERASSTLASDLSKDFPTTEIKIAPIFGKKEIVDLFQVISSDSKEISQLHFIGHSGLYGPMYGTTNYPEQFSPYEIKHLDIPFSSNAKAYFSCCRSARWFAPYFSRTQNVDTYGYHNYTTFTQSNHRFKRVTADTQSVYAIGCEGKKSHGLLGSIKKYTGITPLEKMICFEASSSVIDTTYDEVAELYDAVFQDIKVRKDEWNWLLRHLPKDIEQKTIVDIGCGNGALLKELSPQISKGIGLDLSDKILKRAALLNKDNKNITFNKLDGPLLPLEDHSVDIFISLLSFRYLDWDPLMDELKRVLKPGGQVLIIDMVAVPVKLKDSPRFLFNKIKQFFGKQRNKEFKQSLNRLVSHPDWSKMLKFNPIRAEHEMKWYLESRFPGQKIEKINIGYHSSILAFDSGPISNIADINLSYP